MLAAAFLVADNVEVFPCMPGEHDSGAFPPLLHPPDSLQAEPGGGLSLPSEWGAAVSH